MIIVGSREVRSIKDSQVQSLACRMIHSTAKSIVVMFTVVAMVACSPIQKKAEYSLFSPSENQLISIDVSEFLNHSAPSSSAFFAETLWGQDVTVFAEAPYFSASGAKCRQLVIDDMASKQTGLACTHNNQDWYKARVLSVVATQ